MAISSTITLLSLDQFAQVMGINPAHFNGATTANVMQVTSNSCKDLWHRYSWQSADKVSHEDIALEIAQAEQEIASVLGYWPAPRWTAEDVVPYQQYHRRDGMMVGLKSIDGTFKPVKASYGNLISPGQRAVTSVGEVEVVYSDEDGDGIDETATVSVATTYSAAETKVYYQGHSGHPAWEIREAREKSVSAGVFTATFWAWQMIKPSLRDELFTSEDEQGVDFSVADNLVTSVDVYREYNDPTAVSACFYWSPQVGNDLFYNTEDDPSEMIVQNGCFHIKNAFIGTVVPMAAEYSTDDERWNKVCFTESYDPNMVKLWYYSGKIADPYLSDLSTNKISPQLARIIAYLATARLERPFCSCAGIQALSTNLQRYGPEMGEGANPIITSQNDLANPFGLRIGELMAWRYVRKLLPKIGKVATI